MAALTQQETSFLQAFKNMTDHDRRLTVAFARVCARQRPRKVVSHLTLIVGGLTTPSNAKARNGGNQ